MASWCTPISLAVAAIAAEPSVQRMASALTRGLRASLRHFLETASSRKSAVAPERSRATRTGIRSSPRLLRDAWPPRLRGARPGRWPMLERRKKVSSASTTPVSTSALTGWVSCKKQWRQRNAVEGATPNSAEAKRTISPRPSASSCCNHLAFFRNRASGVLLSALNVRWQARHLKRCKPLALPLRTIHVLAQCGQAGDWPRRSAGPSGKHGEPRDAVRSGRTAFQGCWPTAPARKLVCLPRESVLDCSFAA